MIRVVDFAPEHLRMLKVQPRQRDTLAILTEEDMELLRSANAYTVFAGDKPIICGGVMEILPWRGLAWSFVAGTLKHVFVHVHRVAKRVVDVAPYPRLEMEVECEFVEGHRWANLLGFELETARMRKYGPNGLDYARYVRIQ